MTVKMNRMRYRQCRLDDERDPLIFGRDLHNSVGCVVCSGVVEDDQSSSWLLPIDNEIDVAEVPLFIHACISISADDCHDIVSAGGACSASGEAEVWNDVCAVLVGAIVLIV